MSQRDGHIKSECLREAIKRAINEEEEARKKKKLRYITTNTRRE